jgi:hypothetical protein
MYRHISVVSVLQHDGAAEHHSPCALYSLEPVPTGYSDYLESHPIELPQFADDAAPAHARVPPAAAVGGTARLYCRGNTAAATIAVLCLPHTPRQSPVTRPPAGRTGRPYTCGSTHRRLARDTDRGWPPVGLSVHGHRGMANVGQTVHRQAHVYGLA